MHYDSKWRYENIYFCVVTQNANMRYSDFLLYELTDLLVEQSAGGGTHLNKGVQFRFSKMVYMVAKKWK